MKFLLFIAGLAAGAVGGLLGALHMVDTGKFAIDSQWFGPAILPAWLQAVGGLLAIFVVVGVAVFEQRKRDDGDRLMGQLAAITALNKLGVVTYRLFALAAQMNPNRPGADRDFTSYLPGGGGLDGPLAAVKAALSEQWPTADDLAKMVLVSHAKTSEATGSIFQARFLLDQAVGIALAPHQTEVQFRKKQASFLQSVSAAHMQLLDATNALIPISGKTHDEIITVELDGKPTAMKRSVWARTRPKWWKEPVRWVRHLKRAPQSPQ